MPTYMVAYSVVDSDRNIVLKNTLLRSDTEKDLVTTIIRQIALESPSYLSEDWEKYMAITEVDKTMMLNDDPLRLFLVAHCAVDRNGNVFLRNAQLRSENLECATSAVVKRTRSNCPDDEGWKNSILVEEVGTRELSSFVCDS